MEEELVEYLPVIEKILRAYKDGLTSFDTPPAKE
jgi:hypothetical protein